jgi:hypothetical protein
MTADPRKTVVVLGGPTGPTGTIKGVNILSGYTGPTGNIAQWLQATGATGPSGVLEKVYNIGPTGLTGGHKNVFISGFAGGNPLYVADVLSITSLVGYWRGTDAVASPTLADASPSGVPATIVAGVTLGSTALLAGQSSALFNGTSGTASLGAAGETFFHNYDRTQPFTVEAIIRPNFARTTNNNVDTIFSKFNNVFTTPGIRIGVQCLTAGGAKEFLSFTLMNSVSGAKFLDCHGSTDLTNGSNWHVVISYDGSGVGAGVQMWVNGIPETVTITTNTLGANTIINSIVPQIGSIGGVSNFFNGNIEELAIYNTGIATVASLLPATIFSAERPGLHASLSLGRTKPSLPSGVRNVILSTDIASDIDDAGDVALANALDLRGEFNLLGIVSDSINDRGADTCYAITRYMQPTKTTAFVGAWQGAVPAGGPSNSFYTADISATFGANLGRASFTDGVQKLRALLASVPDGSIPILVGTGFATTFDGLLTSAANAGGDGLPSGAALIIAKNALLVWVAGFMPNAGSADFNFANGPAANSADVIANWPTQVIICGDELGTTITAAPASTTASATNPVQQAFHDWVTNGGTSPRPCWGQLGVLYAARGPSSGLQLAGLKSAMTVNSSTGLNTYVPGTPGNISYLKKSATDATFAALFNSMYAALPGPF